MKVEVGILFHEFFVNAKLPESFSSFFLTLNPKVRSPSDLENIRPISLLGCLNKLVAKVLATTLSSVMDSLVSPMQSAFLKERHLVDGITAVNEVVDFAKRRKKVCLILNMDFEKTYGSVR